jgi:opacity protein-like surface antigen
MTKISRAISTIALGMALAITGLSSASAATWAQKHPRRAEVNGRLANQNRRINTERKDGQLTAAQAADLHAEDRGIRGQERFDASHDGGHITKAEQTQLNHEENGVSGQIGH